jgi:hypothetical protein
MSEINHPRHYGGASNPYEVIKVIEAWALGFHLGNVVKYIARAGRKDPSRTMEDLEKARWYLDRFLELGRSSRGQIGDPEYAAAEAPCSEPELLPMHGYDEERDSVQASRAVWAVPHTSEPDSDSRDGHDE